MIGSLRGRVLAIDGLTALIEDGAGVGYEVEVTGPLLSVIKVDEPCFVYVHHVVREDAELLYGFDSRESRLLFRELIKITGVGPKVAMALLTIMDLKAFIEVINSQRLNALVAAPGVGRKTAERIMVEMKDRIDKLRLGERLLNVTAVAAAGSTAIPGDLGVEEAEADSAASNAVAIDDAVQALLSLGYKETVSQNTVKAVYKPGMTTEEIIVACLAQLGKH